MSDPQDAGDLPESLEFAPVAPGQPGSRLIEAIRQSIWRVESPFIQVDAKLLKTAKEITGVMDDSALVSLALKALIERESARQTGTNRG